MPPPREKRIRKGEGLGRAQLFPTGPTHSKLWVGSIACARMSGGIEGIACAWPDCARIRDKEEAIVLDAPSVCVGVGHEQIGGCPLVERRRDIRTVGGPVGGDPHPLAALPAVDERLAVVVGLADVVVGAVGFTSLVWVLCATRSRMPSSLKSAVSMSHKPLAPVL